MENTGVKRLFFLPIIKRTAATIMIPLLTIYADACGIAGSWIGANIKGDVSIVLVFSQAFAAVDMIDVVPAVIKTFFFGAVIGFVGCYKGYNAGSGTQSVGVAATSAVVMASLLVFIVDMIAVQITDLIIS